MNKTIAKSTIRAVYNIILIVLVILHEPPLVNYTTKWLFTQKMPCSSNDGKTSITKPDNIGGLFCIMLRKYNQFMYKEKEDLGIWT